MAAPPRRTESIVASPPPLPRASRSRAQTEQFGMLHSEHIPEEVMDATLSPKQTAPTQVLAPAKQRGKGKKRSNAEQHAGTLAANLPDTQCDDAAGMREADMPDDEQAVLDAADDNEDHEHQPAAAAAASPKETKRVMWQKDTWKELTAALTAYAVAHSGQLPPSIKTTKSAIVPKAWKEIAKQCSLTKDLEPSAGGKACSLKWANMRGALKVRQTDRPHLLITLATCLWLILCSAAPSAALTEGGPGRPRAPPVDRAGVREGSRY